MAANYKNIKNLSRRGTKKPQKKERPVYELELKVTRVLDGNYGIMFDIEINHVMIYGCRLCETKSGEPFVGFPQTRDRKNPDKWWSVAYVPLTEKQVGVIVDQISAFLNPDEDDSAQEPDEE